MRRTRPWLMLAVALASGGVAALLAMRYLRQQAVPVLAPPKRGDLIIAARPLDARDRARGCGHEDDRVDRQRVAGRLRDLQGRRDRPGVMSPLPENEPILDGKLAPQGAGGGLPVIIDTGKRALTMRVNDVSGVAGFVTPNTRVDVLFTIDDKVNTSARPPPDHHAGRPGDRRGAVDPARQGREAGLGRSGYLPGVPRASRNVGAGLAAGQHSARAPEHDGYHANQDHRDPDERAPGRPHRAAPRAAAHSHADGAVTGRGRGAPAEPDGDRGVSRRRPYVAEILGSPLPR